MSETLPPEQVPIRCMRSAGNNEDSEAYPKDKKVQ
jgi:hypothetical protein